MASQEIFNKLFLLPKSPINFYIDEYIIVGYTVNEPQQPTDVLFGLRGIWVENWEEMEVHFFEWEFTQEAWARAEVQENAVLLEDVDGDEVVLEVWEEATLLL